MMLLSSLFFSLMSAMVRELREVNSFTTVMMRFIVGGLVSVALFASGLQTFRWRNWPWIIARGISGGFACLIFYWSIQHIGLSKAVLLGYTYVIFAAILAVPFLGEMIRWNHWLAIAGALLGIALICGIQNLSVGRGELIAVLGGFISGFAVVCVTKCREVDSSTNIFFSQCVFGIGIVALPTWIHWRSPTAEQWIALAAIGLLAAGGQLCMTYAYKFTGAAHGSLLSLLTPLLGAIIGVAYFREELSWTFLAGALLVLLACCYLTLNPVERAAAGVCSIESDAEAGATQSSPF